MCRGVRRSAIGASRNVSGETKGDENDPENDSLGRSTQLSKHAHHILRGRETSFDLAVLGFWIFVQLAFEVLCIVSFWRPPVYRLRVMVETLLPYVRVLEF